MKQGTTTPSPGSVITADSVGSQIGPLLAGADRWRIARSYRHCFYALSTAGDVLCIGDASIDRGPFTIICSGRAVAAAAALAENRDIPAHDGALLLGDRIVIETTGSALWFADFNRCAGTGVIPESAISTLVERALDTAPPQSFGALIPTLYGRHLGNEKTATTNGVLHLRLLQIVDSVRRQGAFEDPKRLALLLTPLIGLGYGLTPSGDDFCAGWILSLVATGKTKQAAALAAGLFEAAQSRTTAISLAFYRALAESLLSENQARLLRCWVTEQSTAFGDALQGGYRHGATSGWDLLAGFAFGIGLPALKGGSPGWLAHPEADNWRKAG